MARLTRRELCKRTNKVTGTVSYHFNELGSQGYKLREVSAELYAEYEAMAVETENIYSLGDDMHKREYKTVRYNPNNQRG
jgi:hypothetical protein